MFHSTVVTGNNVLSNFQPIQLREDVPEKKQRIEKLGVYHSDAVYLKETVTKAIQYEKGLYAARDVGKSFHFDFPF